MYRSPVGAQVGEDVVDASWEGGAVIRRVVVVKLVHGTADCR